MPESNLGWGCASVSPAPVQDVAHLRPRQTKFSASRPFAGSTIYTRPMAMEYIVQRLEMGDVILIDLPELGGEVEAKVVGAIDRTEKTVRVSLRVEGRENFVKEWPLGEKVTVVRGP